MLGINAGDVHPAAFDVMLAEGRDSVRDDTGAAGDATMAGRMLRAGKRSGGNLRSARQGVMLCGVVEGYAVVTADTLLIADAAGA